MTLLPEAPRRGGFLRIGEATGRRTFEELDELVELAGQAGTIFCGEAQEGCDNGFDRSGQGLT